MGWEFFNKDLSNKDLRTESFIKAELDYTNLSKANLSGVDFSSSRCLGTDFTQADLSGAVFVGSVLNTVNFNRANLSGVNFKGAYFRRLNLKNANLTGTILDPETVPSEGPLIGYRPANLMANEEADVKYYYPGKTYKYPYFSSCAETHFQAGFYFHPDLEFIKAAYPKCYILEISIPDKSWVKVDAEKQGSYRCREFTVSRIEVKGCEDDRDTYILSTKV